MSENCFVAAFKGLHRDSTYCGGLELEFGLGAPPRFGARISEPVPDVRPASETRAPNP